MAYSAGINRKTGAPLTDWDHVVQSIAVILTTPKGTRIMRRDFGSELMDLINRPMTDRVILAIYAATYNAIVPRTVDGFEYGEPRFRLRGCDVRRVGADGVLELVLTGSYLPRGHLGDLTAENDNAVAVIPLAS